MASRKKRIEALEDKMDNYVTNPAYVQSLERHIETLITRVKWQQEKIEALERSDEDQIKVNDAASRAALEDDKRLESLEIQVRGLRHQIAAIHNRLEILDTRPLGERMDAAERAQKESGE